MIRLTPQEQEARRQRLWAEKELARKRKAERAVALRTKRKAQAEKEKEAAATKRKRLAEKKKKLAEATKAEEMKKEMEKRNSAYTVVSCPFEISRSAVSVACASDQASSEADEQFRSVC